MPRLTKLRNPVMPQTFNRASQIEAEIWLDSRQIPKVGRYTV